MKNLIISTILVLAVSSAHGQFSDLILSKLDGNYLVSSEAGTQTTKVVISYPYLRAYSKDMKSWSTYHLTGSTADHFICVFSSTYRDKSSDQSQIGPDKVKMNWEDFKKYFVRRELHKIK